MGQSVQMQGRFAIDFRAASHKHKGEAWEACSLRVSIVQLTRGMNGGQLHPGLVPDFWVMAFSLGL